MNCRDWEERLSLYLEGDLAREDAAHVERHLGECPGCQVFASGLKESQAALHQAHREPLAPAHFAAVRARVLAELERERRPVWRRGWVLGFAGLAAALLVMLAVKPALKPRVDPPVVALAHPPAPVLSAAAGRQGAEGVAPRVLAQGPVRNRRTNPEPVEPVLIRVLSNNPDIVIYWIADARGD